ncbi:MAG: amidohydrolase family protein [Halomonas sp.]|nr:amidohydrolase family protein [Halomonas sp.]
MDANPREPRFTVPSGAVDCHAHVFGPASRYSYHEARTYTPPEASVAQYLHLHETLGIERGVLVQPSVYGLDNSATRDALRTLRDEGRDYRGIAVVDSEVTDAELDALTADGFRGVRLNLLFKGGIAWRDVEVLAGRLADRNWHLQFLVDVSVFEDLEARVRRLPVPVVVDHMGHMPCAKGVDHPGFRGLCRLMEVGDTWVKLSGAYRITGQDQTPYEDVVPLARRLIEANSERCVWGSDWPHPYIPVPMPNDGPLLDALVDWAPEATLRNGILVDNPQRLYFRD